MDFKIRECVLGDAEFIYRLNLDELGYEYPLEETKMKIANILSQGNDKIYVAVTGDIVIGYIHINDYDVIYAPSMKNIMGIAVSGRYRRMGVGKALLSKAEEWARIDGACGIRLVSGKHREGAHKFYSSMGYLNGKEQMNFKKCF